MKMVFKTKVLVHGLLLYSFILSLYSVSILTSNTSFFKYQPINKESNLSFVPADLFFGTAKTENAVEEYSKLPTTSPKNQFNNLVANSKSAELFLLNKISNYIYYTENIAVSFPKTSIIFPFHCFW